MAGGLPATSRFCRTSWLADPPVVGGELQKYSAPDSGIEDHRAEIDALSTSVDPSADARRTVSVRCGASLAPARSFSSSGGRAIAQAPAIADDGIGLQGA